MAGVRASEDATLVEVNPLVKTGDGCMIALDGKVSLDANADFRHPEHEATDKSAEDPLEALAKRRTSTTSSSTGRWGSSATVPAW